MYIHIYRIGRHIYRDDTERKLVLHRIARIAVFKAACYNIAFYISFIQEIVFEISVRSVYGRSSKITVDPYPVLLVGYRHYLSCHLSSVDAVDNIFKLPRTVGKENGTSVIYKLK